MDWLLQLYLPPVYISSCQPQFCHSNLMDAFCIRLGNFCIRGHAGDQGRPSEKGGMNDLHRRKG
jgi:hypothetical protein